MAVKREKPEPLIDDVALCAVLGWTWEELMKQPERFVQKMRIYLNTQGRKAELEQERVKREIEGRMRGY